MQKFILIFVLELFLAYRTPVMPRDKVNFKKEAHVLQYEKTIRLTMKSQARF